MHTSRLLHKVSMLHDLFKNPIQVGCYTKVSMLQAFKNSMQVGWTALAQDLKSSGEMR